MNEIAVAKERADSFRKTFAEIRDQVGRVIVGQEEVIDGTLCGLLAGGHVLLEGVPGLGKTRLVQALSGALHLGFQRIQFTPDLMPADIIGTPMLVESKSGRQFEFQKGPLFAHIVLADEINRATPKTQSALLEAMQEHAVTVGGVTRPLPHPFFVMATQNPLEMEGTYPLPEAQLDRFFFKILVPFPSADELGEILERTTGTESFETSPIIGEEELLAMAKCVKEVPLASDVRQYAVDIVMATHPDHKSAPDIVKRFVRFGASPRGAQSILLGAKIRGLLEGRYHVSREDIRSVSKMALRHRLLLSFEGQAEGISPDVLIDEILGTVGE